MPDKALENLFHDTLKDIYYAERQILKALPGMARGAQSRQLAEAFEKHHDQTQTHVERLQQVFELIGKSPRGKTCPAIDGIIEEGEEVMAAFKIARYGTLRQWANQLGLVEAERILDQTLEEEASTDELLSRIAREDANRVAAEPA